MTRIIFSKYCIRHFGELNIGVCIIYTCTVWRKLLAMETFDELPYRI